MSAGSPIVPIRVPADLLAAVDAVIARTADTRRDGPWTRTSFILSAVREKLQHMHRSNRKNRRHPTPQPEGV